jgi:Fe-S cluster assembly protein SufD
MKENPKVQPNIESLPALYKQYAAALGAGDPKGIAKLRKAAIEAFTKKGFPSPKLEEWKNTSLEEALSREYSFEFEQTPRSIDINKIFRCEIHNFETYLFTQLNGWYIYENAPLSELPNGVIAGSLKEAIQRHPEWFEQHYGKYADIHRNGLIALNTAFAQDGIFIMVPDNTIVEKPIQWVNIVNSREDLFIQPRHLILLGKNSKLTLVHCDDSTQHENTFINSVTEVFVDENSILDHYKLQNKDAGSNLVNSLFIHQENNSKVETHTLTLNGGLIRNDVYAAINGSHCETHLNGLYLVDGKQHVDNQVFVDHISPENLSTQLYKGIIDDEADAVFNGHIQVRRDAQKTEAFQTNRNILLSDNAKVTTKPFLEIYADDVKCSHGATVGQLDPEAMFYIRSRGICERNARMLLMYAFAAEVVNKINIDILRERIDMMVQKRLKGELSICDQCVLHCKDEREITFEIDLTKIP